MEYRTYARRVIGRLGGKAETAGGGDRSTIIEASHAEVRLIVQRLPVPPPEPVAALPKKYRALIGDHAAHPGTGKGRMALAGRSGVLLTWRLRF